jgi:hypothetical protein
MTSSGRVGAHPVRAGSISVGETCEVSSRHLPDALPAGAPCDNVGTERDAHCDGGGPNIVKDGTPQEALSSAYLSSLLSDP